MPNMWFVRSGGGDLLLDKYLSMGRMAIGLRGTRDFREFDSDEEVHDHILNTPKSGNPDNPPYGTGSADYGVWFFSGVKERDLVLLMRGATTITAVGEVKGDYEFLDDPNWGNEQPDYCHIREVKWISLTPEMSFNKVNHTSGFGKVVKATDVVHRQVSEYVRGLGAEQEHESIRDELNNWLDICRSITGGSPDEVSPTNIDYFGHVEGVGVGTIFPFRSELYEAGIHRTLQAGIVGRQNEGAESVVLSGGYVDDEDYGDVIIYTGDGGQGDNRNQVSDQEFTGKNKALLRNHLDGIPVRVVRGAGHQSEFSPDSGYRYDGLYRVERCWRERGQHGFLVCRYRLVKMAGDEVSLPQTENDDGDSPATRTEATVNRIQRDRAISNKVKTIHDYCCQVCGESLKVEGGYYAEAAHIRPLGRPHDGPDVLSNLLCLCPNHHVSFDNGGLFISDDFQIVGTDEELRRDNRHAINVDYLRYHRSIWGIE